MRVMRVDYAGESDQLEFHCVDSELTSQVTVHPAGNQAGVGEDPAVLGLAARVPTFQVAFHLIPGRVGFQKSNTMDQSGDVTHTTLEGAIGDVLEHVRADDEVVAVAEGEGRQLLERAEPNVASLAMAGDDILARIDADVSEPGAQAAEFGTPA